jgi:hypothetical protein
MKTSEKIIALLKKHGDMRPHDLLQHLPIKRAALHRQLLSLQQQKRIMKIGKPPQVIYKITTINSVKRTDISSVKDQQFLKDRFVQITPSGKYLEGIEAFEYWCKKQSLPSQKTLKEYKQTLKKYDAHSKEGLIDGLSKLKHTHKNVHLNKLCYLDFYSIERFGKTKMGTMMLYAKQSQNIMLMHKVSTMAQQQLQALIAKYKCDAIAFVPPTVKRETQFMNVLKQRLALPLPSIVIEKLQTDITVPQKTISKLPDRIENAQTTIFVPPQPSYTTVLLIDDALGSGATMNECAAKLKKANLCQTIIGVALAGSFSGFEVLNEV